MRILQELLLPLQEAVEQIIGMHPCTIQKKRRTTNGIDHGGGIGSAMQIASDIRWLEYNSIEPPHFPFTLQMNGTLVLLEPTMQQLC